MNPQTVRAWGQVIVSVIVLAALVAVGMFAFAKNMTDVITTIVGAILGYAAAVVHFFIGDAAGSQTKDEVIARSNPPPNP